MFIIVYFKHAYLFSDLLQLESPDSCPPIKIAALRTLSYTFKTLGEVRA